MPARYSRTVRDWLVVESIVLLFTVLRVFHDLKTWATALRLRGASLMADCRARSSRRHLHVVRLREYGTGPVHRPHSVRLDAGRVADRTGGPSAA